MTQFTFETNVAKSRRVHYCHWCGEKIEVGQPSIRISGCWDGDFDSCYWHPECDAVYKTLTWKQLDQYDLNSSFDPALFQRGTTNPKD